ncbi:hypothetical protein J6590_061619, partial [Homalodisca vitripennis]
MIVCAISGHCSGKGAPIEYCNRKYEPTLAGRGDDSLCVPSVAIVPAKEFLLSFTIRNASRPWLDEGMIVCAFSGHCSDEGVPIEFHNTKCEATLAGEGDD